VVAICFILAGFAGIGATSHGVALAATGGNSDAAHACQQAGYLTLTGTNGTSDTTFTNTGACVSYAAQGGTLVLLTAAAPCLNGGYANLTSASGSPAFGSEAACVLFVGQGGTPVPVGCVVSPQRTGLYPTIQSAVKDPSCTTIQLLDGTYHEIVTINRDVTILGSGRTLTTVNGSGMINSVFTINSGTVTLDGLTITGGASGLGGGIQNSGTLTVTNSTITGGTSALGGGIYNAGGGTLTVTNSTISGNTAAIYGGGIENEGTATITSSTISHNTAGEYGGGIANIGGGFYGIPFFVATLTVTSSMISDNTALGSGGGIANAYATLTVTNNTFSGNVATNRFSMWFYSLGGDARINTQTFTGNCVAPNNLYPRIGGTNTNNC